MGRKPRDGGAMEKVMLRLPPDMLQRLQVAGGDRGLAEEIRRRLVQSFVSENIDPMTRALTSAITDLANALTLDDVWHEDRFSFEVFKAGVLELLAQQQPEGDLTVSPGGHVFYGPGDDPETVGRMLARSVLRDLQKLTLTQQTKS